jgi:hypothetical protein
MRETSRPFSAMSFLTTGDNTTEEPGAADT